MKKITLLVASIFLFGGGIAKVTAHHKVGHQNRWAADFRNAEPIVFTERGVEFFVFPDGQFDFNTRPSRNEMYYNPSGRRSVNSTYGAPVNSRFQNFGVKVEHDEFGRVRRVGNVFINYDASNRIKRVGSVYMSYNRFALEQVGGLQIIYNHRGQIVDFVGSVNGNLGFQAPQNNRYEDIRYVNDYEFGNTRDSNRVPSRHEQNSNEQDQYYFKNKAPKAKVDDSKVSGSVDVRINKR